MAKKISVKIDTGKTLPLDYLEPLQGNLKELSDDSLKKLKKSIIKNGFIFPIFAWENQADGTIKIIDGHSRVKALVALKKDKYSIPQLPVVMIPADSIDEAKGKLALASSQYGKFTEDGVHEFMEGLDFDASIFEDVEIPFLDPSIYEEPETISVSGYEREKSTYIEGEDDVPEVKEPKSKLGQIFILGDHRLMCGDSTAITDVEKLMNGERADMVFTDPPYGVSYEGGHNAKKRDGIANDTLEGTDLTDLFYNALQCANIVSHDHSAFYIWYANGKAVETFASFSKLNLKVRAVICWYKIKSGLGAFMSQYIPNYEPCIYAHKRGCSPQWFGPTDEKTVWELKKEARNEYHPTQKPVELPERAITNSSKKNDIVLDLFGGSGSTMIAAEKTSRRAHLMELDPKYCDVIVKRWQNFTGKKAQRVNQDGSLTPWDEIKISKTRKKS